MASPQWKEDLLAVLDTIEQELSSAPPPNLKAKLDGFRSRLRQQNVKLARGTFEREVEAFLQGSVPLKTAFEKYLERTLPSVLRAAAAALKEAEPFLRRK